MNRLKVFCPGPSLDPTSVSYEGDLAAINVALRGLKRCDFWVCYDLPNRVHDTCVDDFRRLRPTLVTKGKRVAAWQKWFGEKAALQEHEFPDIEMAYDDPVWLRVATRNGPRYSASMLLHWALTRRYKHIRYVGCDMGGVGYHQAAEGLKSGEKQVRWEMRWRKERALMRGCQETLRTHGYELVGMPWD